MFVILDEVSNANEAEVPRTSRPLCHPDEASDASGRKDFGQLRASEAGTGFEIAKRSSYCVMTIAAVRVSGMLAEATNCVSGGKL